MDAKYRNYQWHTGFTDLRAWAVTADELAHAAELLWRRYESSAARLTPALIESKSPEVATLGRDIGLSGVAYMLIGFAIENFLKGLAVVQLARQAPLSQGDRRLMDLLKTHDLREVLQVAAITLTEPQLNLLEKLNVQIVWGGRYPRPKNPNEFMPDVPGKPDEIQARNFSSSEWREIVALYNELAGRVQLEQKPPA